MYRVEDQVKKLATVTSVMLMAALEAWAQEMQGQTTPARRIVVSIPDKKLALIESGKVVKIFPTAVGAEKTPSPTGSFQIVARISDPTWYHPGKVVPAGKNNPLGPRWLGLSLKGYGIHGTNNPRSIGHNASHGCIRMRNQDVETLFDLVSVGDSVELLGERTPETDGIFGPAPAVTVTATAAAPKGSARASAVATAAAPTAPAPATAASTTALRASALATAATLAAAPKVPSTGIAATATAAAPKAPAPTPATPKAAASAPAAPNVQ